MVAIALLVAAVAAGTFLGYRTGRIASLVLPFSIGAVLLLVGFTPLVIQGGSGERHSRLLFIRLLLAGIGGEMIVLSIGAALGLLARLVRRRPRFRRTGRSRGRSV